MPLVLKRLGLILIVLLGAACAEDPGAVTISSLTLSDAPPGARMRAGYLSVTNPTAAARTLVSARSDAYGLVEFHRTEDVAGQSRMRQEKSVTIAPGQTVSFEPFGRHLMLMRPATPPVADGDVSIELCFDNGDCLITSVGAP